MSQLRVLVVESDPHFAEVIKNALEAISDGRQAPYRTSAVESRLIEVEIVADGNQALQISKTNPPHLILLCVELPKMSGYSICNKLKKNPELKTIPLIIMSSEATPDIFEQHMKLKTRAEDYLIKPFPMEELQEKATALLGISSSSEFAESTAPDGIHGGMTDELINDDTTSSGAVRFEVAHLQAVEDDIEIEDDEVEIADEYLISTDDQPVIDNEINQATDLAFAALEIPDEDAPPSPAGEILIDTSNLEAVEQEEYREHLEEPLTDVGLIAEPDSSFESAVSLEQEVPSRAYEAPIPGAYSDTDAPTRFEPMMPQITEDGAEEPSPYQDAPTRFEPINFSANSDLYASAPAPSVPDRSQSDVPSPEPKEIQVALEAPVVPSKPEVQFAEPVPVVHEPSVVVKPVRPAMVERVLTDAGAYQVEGAKDTLQHDAYLAAQQPDKPEPPASHTSPAPSHEERQQTIKELERDNRRLSDELQHALARKSTASTSFSHDRDMLGLREVINKKEKEILDLKDDLDSKERQILDHKDKVRELERKVRDMDEKLLGIEREMMTVNERCQALHEDKEKIVTRERGVKERLEQAKLEIDKSYQENDLLKKKNAEAMEQLEAETAAALKEKAEEIEVLKDQHLGTLQRLRDTQAREIEEQRAAQEEALSRQAEEHALAADRFREEHEAELARTNEAHAKALAEAEQAHSDEVSSINLRYQEEKDTISATHERELNQLQTESEQALAQERATLQREHEAAMAALKEEHQTAQEQLRREHAESQSTLAERHRQELERRDAEHAGDKEALRTEHKNELDGLVQEHESSLTRLKKAHEDRLQELAQSQKDRVTGMEARHQREKEAFESERQQEKQELTSQIAERDQTLQATAGQLQSTEQELEQSRKKSSELEQHLEEARSNTEELSDRVADLERKSEGYRNQIAQAVHKIRSDEQLADKAKRAMAIAVTLLEEQKMVTHEIETEP